MRLRLLLLTCALWLDALGSGLPSPSISRVSPLSGQRGTTLDFEILGEYLSNALALDFDSEDFAAEINHTSSGKLSGTLRIAPGAALGPHLLRVRTADGFSTTALFNVGQFPDECETEPNDRIGEAQEVSALPVAIQGILDGSADIDIFAINARAGERWSFDMRSIEYGSAVEAKMFLLDGQGHRLSFNDDRDDYLESPFLDHRFEESGTFYVKIDQYRGPRGFNFGKSSTYTLRITALPMIDYVSPLGAEVGQAARISIHGNALDAVRRVYLTAARGAEYARMTYPYTMPIRFRADPPTGDGVLRIEGIIARRSPAVVEAEFRIPGNAETGLWRVWTAGATGFADGPMIDIGDEPNFSESTAQGADWRKGGYAVNGSLSKVGEQDVYAIHVQEGIPLHFWTLSTQLGVPHLDPVLTLRDAKGKRIAENDDVVAGQGTLLGNPDSSLFYSPEQDGVLFLTIKDRTARGGPSYQYRLKVRSERPGFQLFTTPENFAVARGGEGEIKVHLVREEGFEGEVSVWFEETPPGVQPPRGKFRADQLFVPNADGADMIIPEISFRIAVPKSLPAGTYPIRILGSPTAEETRSGRVVEARTTLIMGPLLDLWNFIRRPLPRIEITVLEPPLASLSSATRSVTVAQGGHATLALTAENLPSDSEVRITGLPAAVSYQSSRQANQVTVTLEATSQAALGSFDISAETLVRERWVSTGLIALTVKEAPRLRAGTL